MLGSTLGSSTRRKQRRISYILREEEGRHRSGVNSICLSKKGDLLYSAGRDGTARGWSTSTPRETCVKVFDQHTDWVNDLVLMENETTLVTGSSDTSIMVWNTDTQDCVSTLCLHTDYVKALAVARQKGFVASAGLDRDVYIWDIEASSQPISRSPGGGGGGGGRAPVKCTGHGDSIYSIATNARGSLVISGSIERVSANAMGLIRMWDPRSGDRAGRLKGHTDNVRALIMNGDGTTCVSSGSDATIRVWDIGQQRCVQTIAVHTDSVWALAATGDFTKVFSGGRDCSVFMTELRAQESTLLFQTRKESPPLRLALTPDEDNIWVSSTSSGIEKWSFSEAVARERAQHRADRPSIHTTSTLQRRNTFTQGGAGLTGLGATRSSPQSPLMGPTTSDMPAVPLLTAMAASIPGLPGIVKFDFLENRRHVLTKDSANGVGLWDVTSGKMIRDCGKVDFDEKRKALEEELVVPAWCTADCKLGSLAINLDFPQVFAAELYATDAGHPTHGAEDAKVNVGFRVVRSLLRKWREGRAAMQAESQSGGDDEEGMPEDLGPSLDYRLSPQMRVIVSEGPAGASLCARKVGEFNGDEDPGMLPEWAVYSVERCYPANERGEMIAEAPKVSFHLLRDQNCDIKQLQQGKLNAPQILRGRKVLSYAVQKLQLEIPDNRHVPGRDDAVEYLELICNDKIVPYETNLATIRRFYGKGSDELTLYYRWREGGPLEGGTGDYLVVGNV